MNGICYLWRPLTRVKIPQLWPVVSTSPEIHALIFYEDYYMKKPYTGVSHPLEERTL